MKQNKKIDASLLSAVQYLRVLHRAGAKQSDAVLSLVRHADTVGDAATAFSPVVSDMQLGCSIYDALMRMAETAPSKNLRDFSAGYAQAIHTTGSADDFLDGMCEMLAEEQEISRRRYTEGQAVMGEIYLILFTAAPLFAVIAGMVLSMIADFSPIWLEFLLYVLFPAGAAAFLLLTENPDNMRYRKTRPKQERKDTPYSASLRRFDQRMCRQYILRHPLRFWTRNPAWVLVLSIPAGIAAGMFCPAVFSFQAAVLILTACLPYAVFFSRKERIQTRYREALPGLWQILGGLVSRGMTLADALRFAAGEKSSPLQKDLARTAGEIQFGELCSDALTHFARRLQIPAAQYGTILISESSRFSADVSPALFLLAGDNRKYQLASEALKSSMSLYTAIIYLGYGVYLFTAGVLLTVFMDAAASAGTLDSSVFCGILLTAALIHAVCSGFAAGKLSCGTFAAGVLHVCVMTVVWVLFLAVLVLVFQIPGI